MTSGSAFPRLLTKIDPLTLRDHHYLDAADECYFLGEYIARKGYSYSATNHLILNLKKSMTLRGQPQWRYKAAAIATAGSALAAALNANWLNDATLVPIPPSKAPGDPLYDDRLTQMLRAIRNHPSLDIRELIVQQHSTQAAHELAARPAPAQIFQHYHCNRALLAPVPKFIGLFDDVLTTGAHFKAAQMTLRQYFPTTPIFGIFVARRAPETVDPNEFDIIE